MRNKFVAALLAFFGGFAGLHKFYLRDPGAGVFYIFLSIMTAGAFGGAFSVGALLGFIDGLRYLMMPPEEFDRKFNKKYRRSSGRIEKRRRRQMDRYERARPQQRKRKERAPVSNRRPKKRPQVRNNPFKKSGLRKYKEYEIEEAIEDFKKGLKIEPKDIALHFNLACAYSLLENKEEAFKHLDLAVDYGLADTERIMTHDDLAFLRIQPEFDDFKANGYQTSKKMNVEEKKESAPQSEAKPMDDLLLAQLNRLMELRKKGVLTESEFVRERKKILVR